MDQFILESVLTFSPQSHIGESMLVKGIRPNVLYVSFYKVKLKSELIQGDVIVGVRPALPIEGVYIILRNRLVGGCVWAYSSLFLIVIANKNKIKHRQDAACVVTRAMKQ